MKKLLWALLCVLLCACVCGCAIAPEDGGPAIVQPAASPEPTPAQTAETGGAPLSITRDVRALGDGYVVYPRVVSGGAADVINAGIYDAVAVCAKTLNAPVFTSYRIEYNGDGIFSVLMYINDFNTDQLLALVPLNFYAATGDSMYINDCFDDSASWRAALAYMVQEQATASGYTLLGDVLPISDEQGFYFTGGYIVLVYRLYEIATYDAGMPEIYISISLLKSYIAENGPLDCFIQTEVTP